MLEIKENPESEPLARYSETNKNQEGEPLARFWKIQT